jgi:hypothetical protein
LSLAELVVVLLSVGSEHALVLRNVVLVVRQTPGLVIGALDRSLDLVSSQGSRQSALIDGHLMQRLLSSQSLSSWELVGWVVVVVDEELVLHKVLRSHCWG